MTGCKIPHFGLARQHKNLREELLVATDNALRTGVWVNGPNTSDFTEWLAKRTQSWYALTTHSGTQALEILAHFETTRFHGGYKPRINIPNLSYPATLNAFINADWDIVLKDTDNNGILIYEENYNEEDYHCIVGLYGAAPQSKFKDAMDYNKSSVYVDGAQHWLVAEGNIGEGMAISFDPTKNLPSSGNGGAIVTNNKDLYEFAVSYVDNGKSSMHNFSGTNSKLSEVDCAHLLVRTLYIDEWQKRRKQIRLYWLEQFEDLPIRCLSRDFEQHSDQKFVIYTQKRDELLGYLMLNGIEARVHYQKALSELPVARPYPSPDMMSMSVMLSRGVLSLPIYPELTDSEVQYISEKLKQFFDK